MKWQSEGSISRSKRDSFKKESRDLAYMSIMKDSPYWATLSIYWLSICVHAIGCQFDQTSLAMTTLPLDFKAGIDDAYNQLSPWVGRDCCVVWHTTTGHVVKLDLRSTNTNDWALRGERMNSSLLALSHLKRLDLNSDDFRGIRIPGLIGSVKKLRYLNLSRTYFMGGIPARVGNLSSLCVLNLRAALCFCTPC
ncbi:hypothetical protein C4D60_Mb10t28700 [Musa balbisiana]|uniref:Leucine-rich repeat-containing N-terminal plant-type domain-containing protein n=1 Tax=Musa balbisiana TaxID=52838 RepID=A0A4S8J0J1_MUSBA|nr:hypothetical protein C4D60_Mb10t28700 [Musa balbisiana]